jgi:TolB-like protein
MQKLKVIFALGLLGFANTVAYSDDGMSAGGGGPIEHPLERNAAPYSSQAGTLPISPRYANGVLPIAQSAVVVSSPVSYQPIVTRPATTPSGAFNANIIFIADQLERNRDDDARSKPILVTSFSNLDNLSETTSFGRLLAEQLMHELLVRGWKVVDLRLTKSVIVNQTGEFSLSRDLGRIRESLPAGNVLVGTYSRTTDGVLISARVIDVVTGHVQTSAQSRAPNDRFINTLVSVPTAFPVVKVSK